MFRVGINLNLNKNASTRSRCVYLSTALICIRCDCIYICICICTSVFVSVALIVSACLQLSKPTQTRLGQTDSLKESLLGVARNSHGIVAHCQIWLQFFYQLKMSNALSM